MAKTAPRPHRVTVLLAMLGLAVPVVAALYIKMPATAQNTINKGSGVAVGANSGTINNIVAPSPQDSTEAIRWRMVNEFLSDYILSHDGISPTLDGRFAQAESYINERIAQSGGNWRFNAKTRTLTER